MSRSKWAWMEGCAPVGVVACGVGERAGRRSLLGAVSSTKRLVRLMAASMFVIGVAPAPALAGSASGSHVKIPTPYKQYSTHVDRASAVVLALGSGYSRRGGAARVRTLQRRLAGAGFASGPIDGRYGPRTEQAVGSFQTAHGLGVDGIAGPLTLAALSKPSVALYPGAGYAGHGSARVRVLQRRLAGAGFAPGPIDGRYGPLTAQAVKRFQHAHRLAGRRDRRRADPARARQPTPEGVKPTAPHGARAAAPRGSKATSAHQPDRPEASGDPGDPEAADGSGTAGRAWVFVAEVGDPGRVDRDRDRGLGPGRTRPPTKASDSRGREGGTRGWRCPVGSRGCGTDRGGRGCGPSGMQGRCGTGACTAGGDRRAFARAGDTRAGTRGRTTGAR